MKPARFLLLAMATTVLLPACGRAPEPTPENDDNTAAAEAEKGSDNGMEPVMLHARIDYTSSSALQDMGKTATRISIEIQQPALRTGKGKDATYSQDSAPALAQGFVHGTGQAKITSNDGSIEEFYDKKVSWNSLATQKGYFSIMAPSPSDIGDGLQTEIEIHAPMEGEQWLKALGQQTPDVTFARPIECTDKDEYLEDHVPGCSVKFHIDPTPTEPKSDGGKVVFDKIVDALKQPNGEWTMAMLGQLYGAETNYEDGEFVVHIRKQSTFDKDGSTYGRNIDITVWSSRRDSNWTPKDVTPVKAE